MRMSKSLEEVEYEDSHGGIVVDASHFCFGCRGDNMAECFAFDEDGSIEHWVLCEGGGLHLLDQTGVMENQCCLQKIA